MKFNKKKDVCIFDKENIVKITRYSYPWKFTKKEIDYIDFVISNVKEIQNKLESKSNFDLGKEFFDIVKYDSSTAPYRNILKKVHLSDDNIMGLYYPAVNTLYINKDVLEKYRTRIKTINLDIRKKENFCIFYGIAIKIFLYDHLMENNVGYVITNDMADLGFDNSKENFHKIAKAFIGRYHVSDDMIKKFKNMTFSVSAMGEVDIPSQIVYDRYWGKF